MMEWMQVISDGAAGCVRIVLCLYLIGALLPARRIEREVCFVGVFGAVIVEIVVVLSEMPLLYHVVLEIAWAVICAVRFLKAELRMSLFIAAFYVVFSTAGGSRNPCGRNGDAGTDRRNCTDGVLAGASYFYRSDGIFPAAGRVCRAAGGGSYGIFGSHGALAADGACDPFRYARYVADFIGDTFDGGARLSFETAV